MQRCQLENKILWFGSFSLDVTAASASFAITPDQRCCSAIFHSLAYNLCVCVYLCIYGLLSGNCGIRCWYATTIGALRLWHGSDRWTAYAFDLTLTRDYHVMSCTAEKRQGSEHRCTKWHHDDNKPGVNYLRPKYDSFGVVCPGRVWCKTRINSKLYSARHFRIKQN